MALVVFLRGVNVGGHRTFRPSLLAQELREFGVVNIGAAGTLIVREPGSRAAFRAALATKLPFAAEIVVCEGRELLQFRSSDPFATAPTEPGLIRFVSIFARAGRAPAQLPFALPPEGEWLVRVLGARGRFVCGVYRRHMKTIGHLGRLDRIFGAAATTRNWNTLLSVCARLEAKDKIT